MFGFILNILLYLHVRNTFNSMKFLFPLLLVIATFFNVPAQNLVPNPGFENYIFSYTCQCCTNNLYSHCFNNWTNANGASPDFYGTCCQLSLFSMLGIPNNWFGSQNSHSGNHYSGIVTWQDCFSYNWREYIETPLLIKLDSAKTYYVRFYASLGDTCSRAISNIGTYFSDTLIDILYSNPPSPYFVKVLPFIPQYTNPDSNIITDKLEWTEISGTFTVNGGEKFMIIGNFKGDSSSNVISVPNNGGITCNQAYYYIDDVFVRQYDTIHYPAMAGNDTLICLGDSVKLGLYGFSDYTYQWSCPSTMNNDSTGNPWLKPSVTTTYYLNQTDNYGLQSMDSITVYVDCYPADAGTEDTICKGDTIVIGTLNLPYDHYNWQSAVGSQQVFGNISDTISGIPFVWPDTTTMFYLTVVDSLGNVSYDSVLITVVDCDTLGIEAVSGFEFRVSCYPNPVRDVVYMEIVSNDKWRVSNIEIADMFGKVMMKEDMEAGKRKYAINIDELQAGVYLLKVSGSDVGIVRKVVVVK